MFPTTAQNYADTWVKLEGGTGGLVFSHIVGAMDTLCSQLSDNYSRIGELLVASANGLNATAARYRAEDHATAVRLDALLRPSGVRPVPHTVDVSTPHVDPATTLIEPDEGAAVPDVMQQILDGIGYFSESEIVLKILISSGSEPSGKLLVVAGRQVSTLGSWTSSPEERQCPYRKAGRSDRCWDVVPTPGGVSTA